MKIYECTEQSTQYGISSRLPGCRGADELIDDTLKLENKSDSFFNTTTGEIIRKHSAAEVPCLLFPVLLIFSFY